jgi:hypothetical protein
LQLLLKLHLFLFQLSLLLFSQRALFFCQCFLVLLLHFGHEVIVVDGSLLLFGFQHRHERGHQLLCSVLALLFDLLQRSVCLLRESKRRVVLDVLDFALVSFDRLHDLLDPAVCFLLGDRDFRARVDHEHDREHGEEVHHGNQRDDRLRLVRILWIRCHL